MSKLLDDRFTYNHEGNDYPVTDFLDINGEKAQDPSEVYALVAKIEEDKWLSVIWPDASRLKRMS